MVDIIELQYATMLSNRLERFKIKSTRPYKINCRCPLCGDSKQSKTKSRGWILEDIKTGKLHYYCHNCYASKTFVNFLKEIDQNLFNELIAAKYIDKINVPEIKETDFKTDIPEFNKDPLKSIKKISQLVADHPVKKYIEQRRIPSHQHYRIYYAPKFVSWINSILPDKLNMKEHPRLILPFFDEKEKCFGVSARSFDPNAMRYITIMFYEHKKIFGLDKVDFNRPYYVVEGALDSFFLDNCIAMIGADGSSEGLINIENATWVFDYEPRNKEIHKRMEKLISEKKQICIWPDNMPGKDLNDMFLSGMTTEEIKTTITNNTYSGLSASLRLASWRKT